jgi:hypothetical protein
MVRVEVSNSELAEFIFFPNYAKKTGIIKRVETVVQDVRSNDKSILI